MTMRVLSLRERRLLAGGGLIAALGLSWALVIDPIVSGFHDRAGQREMLQIQYAHTEQTIASLPRLRRMTALSRAATRDFVLAAPGLDAAGTILDDRLRAGIEAAGGDYRGGDHDGSTPDRVRARVVAHITIDRLAHWLERLENEQPYLVVEQLGIGADAALATQKAEPLDVKIEVSIPFVRAAA